MIYIYTRLYKGLRKYQQQVGLFAATYRWDWKLPARLPMPDGESISNGFELVLAP